MLPAVSTSSLHSKRAPLPLLVSWYPLLSFLLQSWRLLLLHPLHRSLRSLTFSLATAITMASILQLFLVTATITVLAPMLLTTVAANVAALAIITTKSTARNLATRSLRLPRKQLNRCLPLLPALSMLAPVPAPRSLLDPHPCLPRMPKS